MFLFLVYSSLKYLVYLAWYHFIPEMKQKKEFSIFPDDLAHNLYFLAFIRLLLGIGTGFLITFLGFHLLYARDHFFKWILIIFPIQWLEWSYFSGKAAQNSKKLVSFLIGPNLVFRKWQASGILVSICIDLLMLFFFGGFRWFII